ncbi:MAG: hypothetical protein ACYCO3_02925 [Mycobacteriales bacterium]
MTGIAALAAIASRLADYVVAVAASVAVLFIAINGVRLIASAGNPRRQAEARSGLISAAVGLGIALSAGLLAKLLVGALR